MANLRSKRTIGAGLLTAALLALTPLVGPTLTDAGVKQVSIEPGALGDSDFEAAIAPLTGFDGAALLVGIWQVDGYEGDFGKVRTASETTASATAIPFDANYAVDEDAIIAHNAGDTVYFTELYDQSGNGLNPAPAADADQPYYASYRKRNDLVGMSLDTSDGFTLPVGLAVDRDDFTVIMVHAMSFSNPLTSALQLGTGTTNRLALYNRSDAPPSLEVGTTGTDVDFVEPSQPSVIVIRSSASGRSVRVNGVEADPATAAAAVAMTGGLWGKTAVSSSYQSFGNLYFLGVWADGSKTTEWVQAREAQLFAKAQIPTTMPTKRLIFDGDSGNMGYRGDGVPISEHLEKNHYQPGDLFIRNVAEFGRLAQKNLDEIHDNILPFISYEHGYNYVYYRAASNDMKGTTDGAAAYAINTSYIDLCHRMGAKIVIPNLNAIDGDATYQARWAAYNDLVNANSAGADGVVDMTTVFPDFNDTTKYHADKVHLNRSGQSLAADTVYPVLAAVMATPVDDDPALPAYDFTAISNIKFDYDPSVLSSVSHFAGRAKQVNDLSANAYHAPQTTAARMPYHYKKANYERGGLVFAGGSMGVPLPAGTHDIGAGANTLFVVFRARGGSGTINLIAGQQSNTGYRYGIRQTDTALQFSNFGAGGGTAASISHTRDTNVHIAGFIRNGTSLTPFLDGVAGTAISTASNTALVSLTIGNVDTFNSGAFIGDIYQVIGVQAALSTSDVNAIGNALATKWDGSWTGLASNDNRPMYTLFAANDNAPYAQYNWGIK